jgi:hypothetical protein
MKTLEERARANADYMHLLTKRSPVGSLHALAVCLRPGWRLRREAKHRRHTLFLRVVGGLGTVVLHSASGAVSGTVSGERVRGVVRGNLVLVPPTTGFSVTPAAADETPLRLIIFSARALWPSGFKRERPPRKGARCLGRPSTPPSARARDPVRRHGGPKARAIPADK